MQENEQLDSAIEKGEAEYLKNQQQRKEEMDIERATAKGAEMIDEERQTKEIQNTFNLNWKAIEDEVIGDAKKEAEKEGKECFLTDGIAEKEFRTYLLETVRGKLLYDILKSGKVDMEQVNDFIQREIEGELKGWQVGKAPKTKMDIDEGQEAKEMAA